MSKNVYNFIYGAMEDIRDAEERRDHDRVLDILGKAYKEIKDLGDGLRDLKTRRNLLEVEISSTRGMIAELERLGIACIETALLSASDIQKYRDYYNVDEYSKM